MTSHRQALEEVLNQLAQVAHELALADELRSALPVLDAARAVVERPEDGSRLEELRRALEHYDTVTEGRHA